ncbi:ribosomal-processing cysteine protease Prp [Amphibacillus sediminis]|uniref:ribosomal-processing cysteine protease Prp n=1 Tax=Amphibacillus sediminis TaxID=360185 RepID=UPI00082EBD4C|nr:ribosomal-processing cysteine protease Prp [Amphibacillus sediminis]
MIYATIFRDQQTNITAFEITGHADSGPNGHDLVCAAVSAVAFGMTNALIKLTEIEPIIDQGGEGGYLRVELPHSITAAQLKKAAVLLEGMLVSLLTIERDYGQYISISDK